MRTALHVTSAPTWGANIDRSIRSPVGEDQGETVAPDVVADDLGTVMAAVATGRES